jgi:hypothetical protein
MLAGLVVDALQPSYREWCDIVRPFRKFGSLLPDEKRKLITSRLQEIRVKDYRVVSLYLPTGEVLTPEVQLQREIDANVCYSCGRAIRHRADPLRLENYCGPCSDGISQLEGTVVASSREIPDPAFTKTPVCDNTFQRL